MGNFNLKRNSQKYCMEEHSKTSFWVRDNESGVEPYQVSVDSLSLVKDLKEHFHQQKKKRDSSETIYIVTLTVNGELLNDDSSTIQAVLSSDSMVELNFVKMSKFCCRRCGQGFQYAREGFVPTLLQCGHALCEGCSSRELRESFSGDQRHGMVVCPDCDRKTRTTNIVSLPIHEPFRELIGWENQQYSVDASAGELPICFSCDTVQATKHCKECDRSFCDDCDVEVHRLRKYTSHSRLKISRTEKVLCSDHNKVCDYFCVEDDTPICSDCFVGQTHQGHRAEKIEETISKQRLHFENCLKELKVSTDILLKKLDGIGSRLGEIHENEKVNKERVQEECGHLIEAIRSREKDLLQAIESESCRQYDEMVHQRNSLGKCLGELRTVILSGESFGPDRQPWPPKSAHVHWLKRKNLYGIYYLDAEEVAKCKNQPEISPELTAVGFELQSCQVEGDLRTLIANFGCVGVPLAPEIASISDITASFATITWKAHANSVAVSSYVLEVRRDDLSEEGFKQVYAGPCTVYQLQDLAANTRYAVRVAAVKEYGNEQRSSWSKTRVFETTQRANAFCPFVLDVSKKSPHLTLDADKPHTLRSSGASAQYATILGTEGIVVRPDSGAAGYVEILVESVQKSGYGGIYFGVAAADVTMTASIGDSPGNSFGWFAAGGTTNSTLPGMRNRNEVCKYGIGDTVGLEIDCTSSKPTLVLYFNGGVVHRTEISNQVYGMTLYPAISIWNGDKNVCVSFHEESSPPPQVLLK